MSRYPPHRNTSRPLERMTARRPGYDGPQSEDGWPVEQRAPGAGAVRLCDLHPRDTLALVCGPCGQRGRYRVASLIGTYGPQGGLPDILCALAAEGECGASTNTLRPCQARFEGLGGRRRSHAASSAEPLALRLVSSSSAERSPSRRITCAYSSHSSMSPSRHSVPA